MILPYMDQARIQQHEETTVILYLKVKMCNMIYLDSVLF